MKTIHIEAFDKSSVDKAIEEVKAIKKEWKRKANLCSEMIAAALADEINKNLSAITMTDDVIDVKTHQPAPINRFAMAYPQGNRIIIKGQDIAFIEFGAGIYHNGDINPNPLAMSVKFDTGPGTYGKSQGIKPYWFIAHNLISRGTPAYMPIQNAIDTIAPQVPTLVRSVFV